VRRLLLTACAVWLNACGAGPAPSNAPTSTCDRQDVSGCAAVGVASGPGADEQRARAAANLRRACEAHDTRSCVGLLALALSDAPWARAVGLASALQHLSGDGLAIRGKAFVIERAQVVIDAAGGPDVWNVTAGWTAPDGVRVCIEFRGPLESGKVTLRSVPSLPEQDVLAKVLVDADGSSASTAPSASPSEAHPCVTD
jgi:hypothetical protein